MDVLDTNTDHLKGYIDLIEDSRKRMYDSMGIPESRLGLAYDPISRDRSEEAYKTMIRDSFVMMRTWFDFATQKMITEIVNKTKVKIPRLPRKLKKVIKNRFGLSTTSRKDLDFNYRVYQMSKYYNRKR